MRKTAKSLIALLLVLALAMSLVACGGEEKTEKKETEKEVKVEQTPEEQAQATVEVAFDSLLALDFSAMKEYMSEDLYASAFGEMGDKSTEQIIRENMGDEFGDADIQPVLDSMQALIDAMIDYEVSETKKDGDKITVKVSLKVKNPQSVPAEKSQELFLKRMAEAGFAEEPATQEDAVKMLVITFETMAELLAESEYEKTSESEIVLENMDGVWIITEINGDGFDKSIFEDAALF